MERIFRDNMAELYQLAFLLTGDRERSVQAYTAALNSEAPAPALQRFMNSWARRLVIVAALGTVRRQLLEAALRTRWVTNPDLVDAARLVAPDLAGLKKRDLEEALLEMEVLQRCAVILTILEGLPVNEAAELLGVDENTVKAAQVRGVTEMTWRLAGVIGPDPRGSSRGRALIAAFG